MGSIKENDALEGIKCPISNNAINPQAVAQLGEGHVYMCCKKCVAAFDKNPEKFLTAANYQLAATGQVDQVGCPFSGREIKEGTAVKTGYAETAVSFCCKNCMKTAEGLDGDARLTKIFGKDAFAKAFAFPAKKDGQVTRAFSSL